jgi:hypothetical protein
MKYFVGQKDLEIRFTCEFCHEEKLFSASQINEFPQCCGKNMIITGGLYDKPEEDTELTEADWADAYMSQSACNLSGLVFSWARIMHRLNNSVRLEKGGTDQVNRHPINRLFAEQVSFLTSPMSWTESYRQAKKYYDRKYGIGKIQNTA